MINKAILKKHNLKAVPFSCIKQGETFNVKADFVPPLWINFFLRRLCGGQIIYADGHIPACPDPAADRYGGTVYVPVWRVTASLQG